MKKKIAIIIVVLCMLVALLPTASRAAVAPHFIAVNDTLLPFNDDTMPYVGEGSILVPYNILSMVGIWSIVSAGFDQVRLFKGDKYVDFYTDMYTATDQDGNSLSWPATQRVRGRYYVPLHQICAFFDITYELTEVGRDVIPNTQIWLIRIISNASLSRTEFIARYRSEMVAAYNAYNRPQVSPLPGETPASEEPPSEEPPPNYSDVTIYLSFRDISAGSAEGIMDELESATASGRPSCFFVSADDIAENPGFIRMIYSSGYTVGIWLDKGTYEEYMDISALLFEATKIKTVLISAGEAGEAANDTAAAHGLLFWGDSLRIASENQEQNEEEGENENEIEIKAVSEEETETEQTTLEIQITDNLPTNSGDHWNLVLDCSEEVVSVLPDILFILSTYDYTVSKITETTTPKW